jgi:hypothetical protein
MAELKYDEEIQKATGMTIAFMVFLLTKLML